MAIGGVQNAQMNALYKVMAELGQAIDPQSQSKAQVSSQEASALISKLQQLDPATQVQVAAGLKQALSADLFEVSGEARSAFANYLQVPASDLTPREMGQLAGLNTARTAFAASLQAVTKSPKIDRKTMTKLLDNAEKMPVEGQQFLYAVLSNASKDRTIEMDSSARRMFRQAVSDAGSGGVRSVSDMMSKADGVGSSASADYLSGLIASGACFEDILAAFMFHMVGSIQDELKDKMAELDAMDAKKRKAAAGEQVSTKELGNLPEVLIEEDVPDYKADTPSADATVLPSTDGPSKADIRRTQVALESVVQSTHHHFNDDGVIDAGEAKRIAGKLERLDGPVADLMARSLLSGLRRADLADKPDLAPIVGWIKGKIGEDVDLSALPKEAPSAAQDPLAQGLRGSDKLEDKIAGFMVDVLLSSDKNLKGKMADFKQFRDSLARYDGTSGAPAASAVPADANVSAAALGMDPLAAFGGPSEAGAADPMAAAAVATGAADVDGIDPHASREMLAREVQQLMQLHSQVSQLLGQMMQVMHEGAMSIIRNIR